MSTTDAAGAPSGAPGGGPVHPTWRDLPGEPPYGPVPPPRTAHIGPVPATAPVDEGSAISPGQIALAVGGVLLLVAIGIGAALFLLGDDDPEVAQDDPAPDVTVAPDDPFDPDPPDQTAPQADPPQGQLEPGPSASGTEEPEVEGPDSPEGELAPEGDAEPGGEALPQEPGAAPAPSLPPLPPSQPDADADAGDVDLPRLFALRTLPAGMGEESTTVRQTTRDDEVVTEQTTILSVDDGGEVTVRATRAEDAQARLDGLLEGETTEDVTIAGEPAHLFEDGRLVWLVPGDPDTLIEVTGPEDVRTSDLVTIAQGLELLR